jgi:hypothetical protein
MAKTDQWDERLRCPNCGRTGTAALRHQGDRDPTPTVLSVPDGFKVVQTEFRPDFHCATCNIAVVP